MMIRGKGNMKKWFMLLALIFVLVVAGGGLGIRADSAVPPAKPTTIRMMEAGETTNLRFLQGVDLNGSLIAYNVLEPLVQVDRKGNLVSKLATKWEQRNSTTWRFYLRKGVKFHNEGNFTASDVVESAKWLVDLKDISTIYDRLPIEKVVAVDEYTVDISLKNPQPLFLINARHLLIYPTDVARDKRDTGELFPVGTGPYKFVRWVRGQKIELAKFEGYWGPKPSIDKVEIVWRGEAGVRLSALLAREVDWVSGLATDVTRMLPKVVTTPSPENQYLRLDESVQKNPILADKRLRLAIDYAINRQDLLALWGGYATVLLGQFARPGDFGYNPDLKHRPYDLQKARDLVKEAGAVGKSVNFAGSVIWPKGREMIEAIANMIEQTGLKVKVTLVSEDDNRKYNLTTGQNRQNTCDIYFNSGDTLLETESRYARLLHKDGNHYAGNDPEASRLFEEVLVENDLAKRGQKLARAWAYNYEQAHYIPLVKWPQFFGLAENLEWDSDIIGRRFISDMRFTR